jgi:hypothetical protein
LLSGITHILTRTLAVTEKTNIHTEKYTDKHTRMPSSPSSPE